MSLDHEYHCEADGSRTHVCGTLCTEIASYARRIAQRRFIFYVAFWFIEANVTWSDVTAQVHRIPNFTQAGKSN